MKFMGYDVEELTQIIREHEAIKHLKGTPAYKKIFAEANLQKIEKDISDLEKKRSLAIRDLKNFTEPLKSYD